MSYKNPHQQGNKPWNYSKESRTKGCPLCARILPWSAFGKSAKAKTGMQTYCNECRGQRQKRYYIENRDRVRSIRAASTSKHHARVRWKDCRNRARRRGQPVCSYELFRDWYAAQPLVCSYCDLPEASSIVQFGRRLHVDRKETKVGYMPGNIVLACPRCNLTKNGYLTFEQMREIAQKYFKGGINA